MFHEQKKEQRDKIPHLILFSHVNSCTQQVQELSWVFDLPESTIVVIDITQAVGNIPLALDRLALKPNVFFVGSLLKHCRCGEGLGFLSYSKASRELIEPASGWTAHVSGLAENRTSDDDNLQHLLYDEGLEWEGGTPSGLEAAYVAVRILKALPTVEKQHAYVKEIQSLFLQRAKLIFSEDQFAFVSESNTLALPISKSITANLPFGLDYKVLEGRTYIRIGFGIHNLDYHLDYLITFLTEQSDIISR
jgi:selenocysteine lyase/cysteine desulfurase